jgi:hypothetical protein
MDVDVQDVEATPSGRRRIVVVKNGSFSGPRLRGRLLPCGGDWLLERADGSRRLDVRITLETHDGALIYASYLVVIHGSATDVSTHYFRTAPLFETAAEQYDWLNHILAVGYGRCAGSPGRVHRAHDRRDLQRFRGGSASADGWRPTA